MYSMAWAEMEYVGADVTALVVPLMQHLVEARQSLSLFQHHDGVTGTAKDHVVLDYAKR
jgi:alpha-mannosidase II